MIDAFRPAVLMASVLLLLFGAQNHASAQLPPSGPDLSETMLPDFTLTDYRGKQWKSSDLESSKLVAVVFVGAECPLVRLFAEELNELDAAYSDQDLALIAVDSNAHDSLEELAHFAQQTGMTCPVVKDTENRLADQLDAQRTPEVFLFDEQRMLRYRGRISNRHTYGQTRTRQVTTYLRDAIDSLLAGQPPRIKYAETEGCIIGRVRRGSAADPEVTYCNQIVRLLQEHCVTCHREGEIAPFALTEYEEVAGWAEMIGEVTRQRRMPPWHADPQYSKFSNDCRLSDVEIGLIEKWIADGAPLGDRADLPPSRTFVAGWQIGTPDKVIAMSDQPVDVPATGVIPYQYFVVDPGFTEDKWIQAAECRPGNRAVVHHIIVGIQGPDGRFHGGLESEWLVATAPGAPPMALPDGFAKRIPAGSKLVFQMHYTPNGTATTDLSHVGFRFADPATVRKEVATREIINTRFRIPPGAPNHEVRASHRVKQDLLVLSLFPHMHLRGKSFRYVAHWPDGSSEILLDVPRYDFNWQNGYQFVEPLRVPAGTRLECIAHYDNSEDNFSNPNPRKTVSWGDQTFDEMMIGYFDAVLADQDLQENSNIDRKPIPTP